MYNTTSTLGSPLSFSRIVLLSLPSRGNILIFLFCIFSWSLIQLHGRQQLAQVLCHTGSLGQGHHRTPVGASHATLATFKFLSRGDATAAVVTVTSTRNRIFGPRYHGGGGVRLHGAYLSQPTGGGLHSVSHTRWCAPDVTTDGSMRKGPTGPMTGTD